MKRKLNKKRLAFIITIILAIISALVYLLIVIFAPAKNTEHSTPNHTTKKEAISSIDYYLPTLKSRYKQYKTNHPNLSNEDVVTHINMNLDYNFYEYSTIQERPDSLNALVNKYYRLTDTYKPETLLYINDGYTTNTDPAYRYRKQEMSQVIYEDFVALRDRCRKKGISFYVVSGYRSTDNQIKSYNHMVKINGISEADKTCSRPGHSEHTLGIACDVALDSYSFMDILKHPDYKWFESILADYGFIIRYPDGKENLTGYSYEPWHLRYLGKDLAKKVVKSHLTYDEYYARYFMY